MKMVLEGWKAFISVQNFAGWRWRLFGLCEWCQPYLFQYLFDEVRLGHLQPAVRKPLKVYAQVVSNVSSFALGVEFEVVLLTLFSLSLDV